MSFYSRWKKLDYYRKTAVGSLFAASGLLLYLLIMHSGDFLFSEWFLDLILIPSFVGNLLSGTTYLGRMLDSRTQLTPEEKLLPAVRPVGFFEKYATLIGVVCGLAVGIAYSVLKMSIPLASTLYGAANALFTLTQIGSLAGLGNRLGNCADTNSKPKNEKYAIGIAAFLGLALSTLLFATAAATLVSVAGATTFLTGGAALPVWICGIIFIGTFTSGAASFADYSAKTYNFFQSLFQDKAEKNSVNERKHEYRGSAVGVSTGVIIGAIIVAALVVTQPYLFAGVVGVIAAFLVISTCVSVLGGLCSRIGRLFDGLATHNPSAENEDKPASLSTPANIMTLLKNSSAPTQSPLDHPSDEIDLTFSIEDEENPAQSLLQNTTTFNPAPKLSARSANDEVLNISLSM